MSTGDTTARNSRASDFSADYTTASLVLLSGVTPLAVHTLAGFGAPATGVITADAIADATILDTLTCDGATLADAAGSYTLTVGLVGSGKDVEISSLTFITGEISSVNSLTVTFPA